MADYSLSPFLEEDLHPPLFHLPSHLDDASLHSHHHLHSWCDCRAAKHSTAGRREWSLLFFFHFYSLFLNFWSSRLIRLHLLHGSLLPMNWTSVSRHIPPAAGLQLQAVARPDMRVDSYIFSMNNRPISCNMHLFTFRMLCRCHSFLMSCLHWERTRTNRWWEQPVFT